MALVILGAGGLAREILWYLWSAQNISAGLGQLYFVDEFTTNTELRVSGIPFAFPIVKDWKFDGKHEFVAGVGSPKVKEQLVAKALDAGLVPCKPLIFGTVVGRDNRIGDGSIIAPGTIVTTNVTIGQHVTVNLSCTIGHDAVIEDYVTFSPGCNISGNVTLKKRSFYGSGAFIREKLTVAEDVTVAAGAAVINNATTPGVTLLGVPARAIGAFK
jgi:sugar O-acyltransferase (sialic acid O-acetyltransferase NeuD family)